MQGNQPRPAQASPNQSELAHNDLNQSKPIRTVQASPSTAPYLPEPALAAAQNSPKWPQMAQNGPKWPKMAQIGPNRPKSARKQPKSASNRPKQPETASDRLDQPHLEETPCLGCFSVFAVRFVVPFIIACRPSRESGPDGYSSLCPPAVPGSNCRLAS